MPPLSTTVSGSTFLNSFIFSLSSGEVAESTALETLSLVLPLLHTKESLVMSVTVSFSMFPVLYSISTAIGEMTFHLPTAGSPFPSLKERKVPSA